MPVWCHSCSGCLLACPSHSKHPPHSTQVAQGNQVLSLPTSSSTEIRTKLNWPCKLVYCAIFYVPQNVPFTIYGTIYNSIQCYTMLYNAIQYNTIHYYTILFNAIQCYSMLFNTMLYNTIQYYSLLYNTIQYNTTRGHCWIFLVQKFTFVSSTTRDQFLLSLNILQYLPSRFLTVPEDYWISLVNA